MANRVSRIFARVAFVAVLASTAAALLVDASSAATRKLSGSYSRSQVEAACEASGGGFYGNPPGGGTKSGAYGCVTASGQVDCDKNGKCTGTCSKCTSVVKGGINGVLRPPASAGATSAAGGTTNGNKPPLHNVNQPVVVQRASGHSGGTKH
jgi:hypothetical protein